MKSRLFLILDHPVNGFLAICQSVLKTKWQMLRRPLSFTPNLHCAKMRSPRSRVSGDDCYCQSSSFVVRTWCVVLVPVCPPFHRQWSSESIGDYSFGCWCSCFQFISPSIRVIWSHSWMTDLVNVPLATWQQKCLPHSLSSCSGSVIYKLSLLIYCYPVLMSTLYAISLSWL